jgi:hypothetical protein
MTENYVETLENKKTFDGYQPGEPGFGWKWWFLTRNSSKLIFYPGRHGLTRIDPVNSVLVGNDGFDPKQPETHFLPWSTWFDPVDSVLVERCGWLEKNIFLNFKLFLNFFWIFINNNRNKITFKKILVNPKLGYNKMH